MFLALLRVYLQPASGGSPLIEPALELLARHGSQINASEVSPPKEGWITKSSSIHTDMQEFFFLGYEKVLSTLPAETHVQGLYPFFEKSIRESNRVHYENMIVKNLLKAEQLQVKKKQKLLTLTNE